MDSWDVLDEDLDASTTWTRTNVGEAFPGVPTPLTWSWAGTGSEWGVRRAWGRLGTFATSSAAPTDVIADRFVAITQGRAVLNLSKLREVGDRMPGSSAAKVEDGLFSGDAPAPPGKARPSRYPVVAVKAPFAVHRARRWLLAEVQQTERWWAQSISLLIRNPAESRRLLVESRDRYVEITERQTICSIVSAGVFDAVESLCKRADLAGSSGALTAAGEVTPELLTVEDLWRVSRDELSLAVFLERHGYHSPVQGELAHASWRGDAAPLASLLVSLKQQGPEDHPRVAHNRRIAERAQLQAQLFGSLSRPLRVSGRPLLRLAQALVPLRQVARMQFLQCYDVARAAAEVLGRELVETGALAEIGDVYFCTVEELVAAAPVDPAVVALRRERRRHYQSYDLPGVFVGKPEPILLTNLADRTHLVGLAGSPGTVRGRARVITDPTDSDDLADGEILVCETTNPSWAAYFLVAGAVVVDIGGPLSHGAIVAREMGIPCVINTGDARLAIRDGDLIEVDGTAGTVEILERADTTTAEVHS